MFLVFSNYFNILILKIIFKNSKNIIHIYFNIYSCLKNKLNQVTKHSTLINLLFLAPKSSGCEFLYIFISCG